MNIGHVVARRFRALFRKDELEQELDDELRFHLAMQTDENLRRGMSPEEARRQAMLLFGGIESHKEAARDARRVRWLEDVWADVRYAIRGLRRSPGFTLVVVATLMLGIGANSALLSLANALLWTTPPGIGEAESLWRVNHVEAGRELGLSYRDYVAFRDQAGVFDELAASNSDPVAVAFMGEPQTLRSELVTGNYFTVLRMKPVHGRVFTPAETRELGTSPVVVLSHGLWRRYGASSDIIGQPIHLGGMRFTVIGVAAEGFRGLNGIESPADLWIPVSMYREAIPTYQDSTAHNLLTDVEYGHRSFSVVGRLKPGITSDDALPSLELLTRRAAAVTSEAYARVTTELTRLRGMVSSADGDVGALYFGGAVTLIILLIACANVANLLLARASGRGGEIAIRRAIGASRGRIVRQLLVESLFLALLGGAAGALAGNWIVQLFIAVVPVPIVVPIALDPLVLMTTMLVSIASGVIFGLSPALRASRADLNTRGASARTKPQGLLIGAQLALSFVLLVIAGVILMTLRSAIASDVVYSARDEVLTLAIDLNQLGYSRDRQDGFKRELLTRASALPGVEAASFASTAPGHEGFCSFRVAIDGSDLTSPGFRDDCPVNQSVGPRYFTTLGVTKLRGRDFIETDRENAPQVAIVNEAAVSRFWPGLDPIGRQIRVGPDTLPFATVVGVVPDALAGNPRGRTRPAVYWAGAQTAWDFAPEGTIVLLRTRGDPIRFAAPLRSIIRDMDPDLPVSRVRTLREVVEGSRSEGDLAGKLLLSFGALALALSLVGLYGLVAFSIRQRTREVGIRIALGASRRNVLSLFCRDTLRVAGTGVVAGTLLALAAAVMLARATKGIGLSDVLTLIGVAGVLLAAALAATLAAGRRALVIDPLVATRSE